MILCIWKMNCMCLLFRIYWCWINSVRARVRKTVSYNYPPKPNLNRWSQGMGRAGRVPDVRVRVQVRVLVLCMSASTSTSTWLLHEYEYEYWLMSTSTSTGLWSTFYSYLSSSIAFFSLWKANPQILMNLGQSPNCPLSMLILFVNISV